jgi:hypothetical protein
MRFPLGDKHFDFARAGDVQVGVWPTVAEVEARLATQSVCTSSARQEVVLVSGVTP